MLIALTFIAFLILFTVVGVYASTQKQDNTTDYLLAGRNVNPWAIAIMLAGVAGSLIWKIGLNLSDAVYKVFPGMATGLLVYLLSLQMKKLSKKL